LSCILSRESPIEGSTENPIVVWADKLKEVKRKTKESIFFAIEKTLRKDKHILAFFPNYPNIGINLLINTEFKGIDY
jgi:hypothetical protein